MLFRSANDANKMPCFGIVDATVSANADCSVVTFGTLQGLDTSSFSEGDELFVSDTGTLTTTAPTGESSQIQKIGKVTRSHASAGSIKVMGAGRTNAVPNLNDGQFFLGNGSNQAVSTDFTTSVLGEISAGTGIGISGSGVISNSAPDQTVSLTGGTGISTSGTYPNFTITNDSPDQTVSLTGAGATSISGTYPNFTITSTDNNTTYTAGTGITLTGTEFSLTDTNAKLNVSDYTAADVLTKIKTVDGSGSGLDADTVDGVHASAIMQEFGSTTADLDTLTASGAYRIQNSNANRPADWGQLLTVYGGLDTIGQIYFDYSDGNIKTRAGNPSDVGGNGSWSAWRTVWTDENDGSGSGLDADTVDGIQASSFLQLSGGTMAGTLNFNNNNITNVNHLTFNDSGVNEGLQWLGGSDWRIFESPDNLTNASGNLQFTTGGTRRMTLNTNSTLEVQGAVVSQGGTWASAIDSVSNGAVVLNKGDFIYSDDNSYLRIIAGHNSAGKIQIGQSGTALITGIDLYSGTSGNNTLTLNGNKIWNAGNDGSGSGLDADLLDGLQTKTSSGTTGANQILRSHSNNYFYHGSWIWVQGGGLFANTNNAHFTQNTTTSYGSWKTSGSKGGYDGIVFDSGGDVAIMYDSSGNGGLYRQANGRWHIYHHVGNNCLGIGGSGTSSTYEAYVHGDLYATGNITAYSDARIKENVETIDSALEKVESMRGVYYNKIDDPDKTKEVGFIAQEVNEVIPEAVTYAEDVDQYGVKYANITALLVESVKELSQQVKDLQAEVKELKENV